MMYRLQQWSRRVFGRPARADVPPVADNDRQGTRHWAATPQASSAAEARRLDNEIRVIWDPARSAAIERARDEADAQHWRTQAQEVEVAWQQIPLAHRLHQTETADRRTLDDPLTVPEQRADAHERAARLQLGRPGHDPHTTLPRDYLDVHTLSPERRHAMRAADLDDERWSIAYYTYDPALQGHRSWGGTTLFSEYDLLDLARDEARQRGAAVPVFTEDRALRRLLTAHQIPLGPRLTNAAAEVDQLRTPSQQAHIQQRDTDLDR